MTRYADKLMTSGEVIILRARQHWAALLLMARRAFLVWIIAAIAIAVYAVARPERELATVLGIVILVLLVLGALIFLFNLWHWWSQDYLVTNRRVMKVEGIINKNAADSSLEKINDATLHQNLFGRMLNYGDLDILTAADTAVDRFGMLAGAPEFKRQMLQQKYALETEHTYRQAPTPPLRSDDRAPTRRPMTEERAAPLEERPSTPAYVTDDGPDGGDVGRSGMASVGMTGGGLGMGSVLAESRVADDDEDQALPQRDPGTENATSTWALESATPAPTASGDTGGAVTTGGAGSPGPSTGATTTPMAAPAGGTSIATPAPASTPSTAEEGATQSAGPGVSTPAAAAPAAAPTQVPPPAPAAAPEAAKPADAAEITATLARLADLRDRGAISAEEYDGKKRELLDRL